MERINNRLPEEKVNFYAMAKDIMADMPEWGESTPYQIKRMAIKEATNAFFTTVKLLKAGHITHFSLRFRSAKSPTQSCYIPSSAIKPTGVYSRILGKMKYAESLPENPKDSRLVKENGKYYLTVPYSVIIANDESQIDRVVSLDPGIRTFLTGYSSESAFKLGEGDFKRLTRLCLTLDKLISFSSQKDCSKDCSKDRRRRLKKSIFRVRDKIRNLTKELHFKCAKFLTDNFDVILLPSFETSDMVKRAGRKIGRKTVRSMLTFSFYQFTQRLKHVATQKHKRVIEVNEAYTSKTASWTGEVVNIGSSKFITSRGQTVDRDINGARGIYLRALVDRPWLSSLGQA